MGFSGVAPGGDYATRRRRRRAEQHDDEQGKRGASGIVSALAAGVDRDFHRVALGGDEVLTRLFHLRPRVRLADLPPN